jgi:hypothetical protein
MPHSHREHYSSSPRDKHRSERCPGHRTVRLYKIWSLINCNSISHSSFHLMGNRVWNKCSPYIFLNRGWLVLFTAKSPHKEMCIIQRHLYTYIYEIHATNKLLQQFLIIKPNSPLWDAIISNNALQLNISMRGDKRISGLAEIWSYSN